MEVNDIELADETFDHIDGVEKKAHPWRRCPWGKHLVKKHTGHTPPSKNHPNGADVIWHEHCANNPSKKEELSHTNDPFRFTRSID